MKCALEASLGRKVSAYRRILSFKPDYGAYLLNRLEVGKDGKTAYERCKGKKAKVLGLEFGEKLLFKWRPDKGKLQKMNPRWRHGLFVGLRERVHCIWGLWLNWVSRLALGSWVAASTLLA